jgi:hypothetical protein
LIFIQSLLGGGHPLLLEFRRLRFFISPNKDKALPSKTFADYGCCAFIARWVSMKSFHNFLFGKSFLLVALCLAALQGCSTSALNDAEINRTEAAMQRQEIVAGLFRLTLFSRIRDTNKPITAYIEGDVRGWIPAADPNVDSTPDEYLGLRLARLDPSDNVIVISRPCQFNIADPICLDKTWANGRWAEQIYMSINRALDYAVASVSHTHLNLVGYSGGGAIATLLAARRHDVISLRTVAGNLDPNGNGRTHLTDPQDDFIDPMEIASRLSLIPQEHFVGDKDTFVPPSLTENFVKAIGVNTCVKITHSADATHKTGWEEVWEDNVERMPVCGALSGRQEADK